MTVYYHIETRNFSNGVSRVEYHFAWIDPKVQGWRILTTDTLARINKHLGDGINLVQVNHNGEIVQ